MTAGARLLACSGNILLRQLSSPDQCLLAPHIEQVAFGCGTILVDCDEQLDALFFPESALVSLGEPMGSRRHIEVALVGREGMLGWPALLGCGRSPHQMAVQLRPGTLLRIEVDAMRRACARSATLWPALLRFVHTIYVQMARAIATHLEHSIDQRLARWLLMRHDRLGGDIMFVLHEEIADSLSVRRASVTDSLHILEGERHIRCNRGRIVVRDRKGLEAFAGSAYGFAEAQYSALIAPFGKTTDPAIVGTPAPAAQPAGPALEDVVITSAAWVSRGLN